MGRKKKIKTPPKNIKLESKLIRRTDGFKFTFPMRRLERDFETQGKRGRGKHVSGEIRLEWRGLLGGRTRCLL